MTKRALNCTDATHETPTLKMKKATEEENAMKRRKRQRWDIDHPPNADKGACRPCKVFGPSIRLRGRRWVDAWGGIKDGWGGSRDTGGRPWARGGGWRQWVGDRASIIVSRMQMTATGDGPGASISTDCSLPRRHLHHQRRRIAFFPLSLSLSLFLLLFLIPRSSFTFLFLLISFLLFLPHPSSRTEWWRCGRYGPFVSFFSRSMLQRPRRSRGSLVGSGAIAVTR